VISFYTWEEPFYIKLVRVVGIFVIVTVGLALGIIAIGYSGHRAVASSSVVDSGFITIRI